MILQRRDTEGPGGGGGGGGRNGRGGRGGGGGGGDRGGYGDRGGGMGPGGPRNGQDYSNGGWGDQRQEQQMEVTFVVPSNKCGVIIGKGNVNLIFLSCLFKVIYKL